jgi:hypothetical protein
MIHKKLLLINGVDKTTSLSVVSTGAANIGTNNTTDELQIGMASGNSALNGAVVFARAWNVKKTLAELQDLHNVPWRIFKPLPGYFPVAAAGSTPKTATANIAAAIQAPRSANASVAAAIRVSNTSTASLSAAIAQRNTATASERPPIAELQASPAEARRYSIPPTHFVTSAKSPREAQVQRRSETLQK